MELQKVRAYGQGVCKVAVLMVLGRDKIVTIKCPWGGEDDRYLKRH